LGASARALWTADPGAGLAVTVGYFAYDLAVSALFTVWSLQAIRRLGQAPPAEEAQAPAPSLTLLIAAYNERLCILDTLASIRAQGVACEVIVASDGSSDGMDALVVQALGLTQVEPQVHTDGRGLWLLTLPRGGKGAALNAALARATGDVVVTLDADTLLGEHALRRIAEAFRDPEVAAAAGFVYVRNGQHNLLTRYQFTEYVKNFVWRMGLAHAGVNLQVSGAFGGLRTAVLRRIGGFAGNSLVEDYEVIYRLHDRLAGTPYRIVAVPLAAAFTESPVELGTFINQRTRWFTGFLQTLWTYRAMIGDPSRGRVGRLMLPIKAIDACLPLWGLLSLGFLIRAGLSGQSMWPRWALGLSAAKWAYDAVVLGSLVTWHARTLPQPGALPGLPARLATTLTEGLGFNWLRQVAVIRAYVWFFQRKQAWHQPRWELPAPLPLPLSTRSSPDLVAEAPGGRPAAGG
jgi:cellulose synthase/poly-beta-1,6-N-acetylglucosamine synthase-like glycosyltransferase